MKFEPLYYGDRLQIVNPEGDVAVVTLWSKVESAVQILLEAGVDLWQHSSRIAVIANLYGNGLPHMLRNLLYNPQIQHIIIVGKNLSGSREWLLNFFEHGLEEVEFLGAKAFRIKNTNRTIDSLVTPDMFSYKLHFTVLGDVGDSETKGRLRVYFLHDIPTKKLEDIERIQPPEIPEPEITRFPSEPRSHTIVRDTPMEAWTELIFRLFRFGHRNTVMKSSGPETRIELQNVHVVVENPEEESDEILQQYGFSLEKFGSYQARILDPSKPSDQDYTYGNRLRRYFQRDGKFVDSLVICANRLGESPDSRQAYIALWDNTRDLPEGTGCPCFVSAFFRKFEDVLTLTATFRVHNAMDAWPENLYGLMAIQRYVADIADIPCGPITVISHSISIDPSSLEKAKKIASAKESDEVFDQVTGKWGPRMDPNGEFTVTFDREKREIVVQHSFNGMVIGQYIGKNAEELERQLARDVALSDISHALYLGREIARKEAEMKSARAKEKEDK